MKSFTIILNVKAYHESTIEGGKRLCAAIDTFVKIHPKINVDLHVAPNLIDLQLLKLEFPNISLIAQHIDAVSMGKQTGWIPAGIVKRLGIEMTILNHTEHRLKTKEVQRALTHAHETGMKVVVCCQTVLEAKRLLRFHPYAIALEPPELIGSGKSITAYESLVHAYMVLKKGATQLYVGAGISNSQDIAAARSFGVDGVLLSSAFVFAPEPFIFIQDLVNAAK